MDPAPTPLRHVAIALVAVLLISGGIFVAFGGENPSPRLTQATELANNGTGRVLFDDTFDGTGPIDQADGLELRAVGGTWMRADGHALLAKAAGGQTWNTLLVDPSATVGAVEVTIGNPLPAEGIVFRYRDPKSFWALTTYSDKGWVLTKSDGEKSVGVTTISSGGVQAGDVARVVLRDSTIDIWINDVLEDSITDEWLQNNTRAGLAVVASITAGDGQSFDRLTVRGTS